MKTKLARIALALLLLAGFAVAQDSYITSGQSVVERWISGKTVNVAVTTQTGGDTYLTIPDFAGIVDEFTFKTKAQTLANKTLTAPILTTPTLGVASATSISLTANQINFAKTVTLTEAGGAELVATFTSAATNSFAVEFEYRVAVADAGPDQVARGGSMRFVCANKATAVTCTKDATNETDDESVLIATNAQTLTYAIAIDVGTANVAKITFNIDSDQTSTSASIVWTARANGLVVIS